MPSVAGTHARIWASLDCFAEDGAALGRRVANTTFLQALLRADPYDAYHFFPPVEPDCARLHTWFAEHHGDLLRRGAVHIAPRHTLPGVMAETSYHCMHLADPLSRFARLAQARNAFSRHIFPITGITHSLSYERYVPEYLAHLWPGVSPRDALVVTSDSARQVMERIFSGLREEYDLDAARFSAPKLERIPLGVNAAALPDPAERWDAPGGEGARGLRARLGLDGRVLFLCLSRICPHSKMDLLPLLRAFERAFALGLAKEKTALVLAGWADGDDPLPDALRALGQRLGIETRLCLRPDDAARRELYAAADVFLSPSDNLQETFGLTLAEAGAASLPVIASDFDGYRDIVRHEETGLLVPTLGFAESGLADRMAALWYDNQYHLMLAQQTVVDVPQLARSIVLLGSDEKLRRAMGQKARHRILERFSWATVIARYVSLWDGLAAERIASEQEQALRGAAHPLRMRFADYFGGYFSERLEAATLDNMLLIRTKTGEAVYRGALPSIQYAGMQEFLDAEAARLLLLSARKAVSGTALMGILQQFFLRKQGPTAAGHARESAAATLLWALKHDLLERAGE